MDQALDVVVSDRASCLSNLEELSKRFSRREAALELVSDEDVEAKNCLVAALSKPAGAVGTEAVDEALRTLGALSDDWSCRKCALEAVGLLLDMEACTFDALVEIVGANLEHDEARVRNAAAGALYLAARARGPETWRRFGATLVEIAAKCFAADKLERTEEAERLAARAMTEFIEQPPRPITTPWEAVDPRFEARTTLKFSVLRLTRKAEVWRPRSDSIGSTTSTGSKLSVIHETMGWRALETSIRALSTLVRGYGPSFCREAGEPAFREVAALLCERAAIHENRFVREVAQLGLSCLAYAGLSDAPRDCQLRVLKACVRGMEDNWTQVRFAASQASRALMLALTPEMRADPDVLDLMVPSMCLNRYYTAEGVREYANETWRAVFGTEGARIVAERAKVVCDFYVSQCLVSNHVVRESVCQSIGEFAVKVDPEAIRPFAPRMLAGLYKCFQDESWTVRQVACLACAKYLKAFPVESRDLREPILALFLEHVSDNVASVREDAAVALCSLIGTQTGEEMEIEKKVVETIQAYLPHAAAQINHEDSLPRAEMVARKKQEEEHKHENQVMFSCGSLAPGGKKARHRPRGFGCCDHGYSRDKYEWEFSDGAVYLLRELAAKSPTKAVSLLPELTDSLARSFRLSAYQETIWTQLPLIARACEKRAFKSMAVDALIPSMAAAAGDTTRQNVSCAALSCRDFLAAWIGEGIFEARVRAAAEERRDPSVARILLDSMPPPVRQIPRRTKVVL